MPTILGPRFDPTFMGLPPRMSAQDYEIWIKFRPRYTGGALGLYFDVGLGEGFPTPDEVDPAIVKMWLKNTQKRADLIMETKEHIKIIEFRSHATATSLGRLLMYGMLWERDPIIKKPIGLYLCTNSFDQEVKDLADELGILYEVF